MYNMLEKWAHPSQGCQIFHDTTYQNGGKICPMTTKLPNGHKIKKWQ
jgi:hypothetical protein